MPTSELDMDDLVVDRDRDSDIVSVVGARVHSLCLTV